MPGILPNGGSEVRVNGREVMEALKERLGDDGAELTDGEFAQRLGVTTMTLNNWRRRGTVTVRQMVGLIARVERASQTRTEGAALRPIVEFFRLQPVASAGEGKREIFAAKKAGADHRYLAGLRRELEEHRGVYVFDDSRGRALYVGRTATQSLWAEIKSAYNRDRTVQTIRRVAHPSRDVEFRTLDEKRRQIKPTTVPLHDIAHYLSAYHVADGLIGNVESLLIRGFANDLLNVKMENLAWDARPRTQQASAPRRRTAGGAADTGS